MQRMTIQRICALAATAMLSGFVSTLPTGAQAQSQPQTQAGCQPEQFAALIDSTGQYLREFALSRKPQLLKKFAKIAQQRGWKPELAEEKGYQLVQDSKVLELDARARKLVIELDQIDAASSSGPTCEKLEHLRKVTIELRAVTEAKFNHMMNSADRALKGSSPPKPSSAPTVQTPPPAISRDRAPPPTPSAAPRAVTSAPTIEPRPTTPGSSAWQTTTEGTAPPSPVLPQLQTSENLPAATTFTAAEIRDAGRGFFGNISAGLASVIQYTFQQYGAPDGYILGSEGGGAFLAGISYGEGRLTMKSSAPIKVYWQGPSVGYDLGVQGGRVMFLIYNLEQPEQIFHRFAGIGGSAYVVGGAGLTFHKRGNVVLAPIRTGLGLRLGANIGYLKFTPRMSINPF